MTRLLTNSQLPTLEVQVHSDGSIFYVKEGGNFISHLTSNNTKKPIIRKFTCDTIPFSVPAQEGVQHLNP